MILHVVRHAEAEHNLLDLAHDTTVADVPLTSKGVKQAQDLSLKFKDYHVDVVYVSQLLRTQQTGLEIALDHGVQIIIDPLLNDIVTGFAGKQFSEFKKMLLASNDPWNAKFEHGESFNEEKERVKIFIDKLHNTAYKSVLVVTSGGIANIIYGLIHNLTNEEIFNRPIHNTALFTVEI